MDRGPGTPPPPPPLPSLSLVGLIHFIILDVIAWYHFAALYVIQYPEALATLTAAGGAVFAAVLLDRVKHKII